jgi:hypothetical protein
MVDGWIYFIRRMKRTSSCLGSKISVSVNIQYHFCRWLTQVGGWSQKGHNFSSLKLIDGRGYVDHFRRGSISSSSVYRPPSNHPSILHTYRIYWTSCYKSIQPDILCIIYYYHVDNIYILFVSEARRHLCTTIRMTLTMACCSGMVVMIIMHIHNVLIIHSFVLISRW